MKVNSFINQPDESIHQISGPAPSYQSFSERKNLEQGRRIVRSYRDSHLGSKYGERGKVQPGKRTSIGQPGTTQPSTRQEMNASQSIALPGNASGQGVPHSFTEPTSRSFNPYA